MRRRACRQIVVIDRGGELVRGSGPRRLVAVALVRIGWVDDCHGERERVMRMRMRMGRTESEMVGGRTVIGISIDWLGIGMSMTC